MIVLDFIFILFHLNTFLIFIAYTESIDSFSLIVPLNIKAIRRYIALHWLYFFVFYKLVNHTIGVIIFIKYLWRSNMNNKRHKKVITIFAILYFMIGLLDLIGGSAEDSRFYILDDALIRTIGVVFILSSIGLLLKKEIARKETVVALVLSLLEIIIGFPQKINTVEFIIEVIIMLILYIPGLVYFIVLKNKGYFLS